MVKRIIILLLVLVLLVSIVRIVIGEPCYVSQPSMSPSILPGDWIWINKSSYGSRLPVRWADIPLVNVFTWIPALREADMKNDWGYHRLPGWNKPREEDIIVFNDPLNEDVLLVKRIDSICAKGSETFYFVLGDNRHNSTDSRNFGWISHKAVVGRVDRVLFSVGESGIRSDRFFRKLK